MLCIILQYQARDQLGCLLVSTIRFKSIVRGCRRREGRYKTIWLGGKASCTTKQQVRLCNFNKGTKYYIISRNGQSED